MGRFVCRLWVWVGGVVDFLSLGGIGLSLYVRRIFWLFRGGRVVERETVGWDRGKVCFGGLGGGSEDEGRSRIEKYRGGRTS